MAQVRPPNVVLILADDMGFSDLGCYGSEIRTPNLDSLARGGVQMTQFYNTARCSPSRASLLTGLHPHQTGIGVLTNDDRPIGYPGTLNERCITVAELLQRSGYTTAMRGKWHLSGNTSTADRSWPTRRGFGSFFGILAGAASYYDPVTLMRDETPVRVDDGFYLTSALGREAAEFVDAHVAEEPSTPFLLYLPFTAPHWPLHAPKDIVAHYHGVFDAGWDDLRERRHQRLKGLGLISGRWDLPPRDAGVVAWSDVADKAWQARRMEVYAAQIEIMDAAIGELVAALQRTGQLDNTLIVFLSDNGGCAEEMAPAWVDEMPVRPYNNPARTLDGRRVRRGNDPSAVPGGPETFASYGRPWANVSNTPFREYKHFVHEGGIATPLIAHWPAGQLRQGICATPHQLPDVLATIVEACGVDYAPGHTVTSAGVELDVPPLEGVSMLSSWQGSPVTDHPLYFEHEGNCAIREGRWKLVRKFGGRWELYDLVADRTETHDLAATQVDRVKAMALRWQDWAVRCGVKPYEWVSAAMVSPRPGGTIDVSFTSSRPE